MRHLCSKLGLKDGEIEAIGYDNYQTLRMDCILSIG